MLGPHPRPCPAACPHPPAARPARRRATALPETKQPARRGQTGLTAWRWATARRSSGAASALPRSYASRRSGPSALRSTQVRRRGGRAPWGPAGLLAAAACGPPAQAARTARPAPGRPPHIRAGSWGFYGLLNWLPSFFKDVYHVEIAQLASFTLAPYVLQGSVGVFSGEPGWVPGQSAALRGRAGRPACCRAARASSRACSWRGAVALGCAASAALPAPRPAGARTALVNCTPAHLLLLLLLLLLLPHAPPACTP